jgi:hypothetical protein
MADSDLVENVRGGALVGAGFGGVLGAVIGWIMASSLVPVPVIGPVVGQGVLSTAVVAALAGMTGGALLGALFGVFSHDGGPDLAPVQVASDSYSTAPVAARSVPEAAIEPDVAMLAHTGIVITPADTDAEVESLQEPVVQAAPSVASSEEPLSPDSPAVMGTPVLRVRRRRQVRPESDTTPDE